MYFHGYYGTVIFKYSCGTSIVMKLETEKINFIQVMDNFFNSVDIEEEQFKGRPKTSLVNVIKALCLMSYTSMSYRRIQSDINFSIPKSTLNDYVNNDKLLKLLEKLIQMSAMLFIHEDNLIIDSTWFGEKMYTGGYRKVHNKNAPLGKVRKLHIACLRESKIIVYAKATKGTVSDSPILPDIISKVKNKGFNIKTLIADAGYSSKNNYAICRDNQIFNVFINFRKNATLRRAKSSIWREQLTLFKENKEVWNQTYKLRVIVESIFSVIKRKNLNYLRSRNETSKDVEILLKVLVYNLTIISKYSLYHTSP